MRIGLTFALLLLLIVTLAGAQPPPCAQLRFQHVATWEPFVCIHIEGPVGCPAANVRGYVTEERSGNTCSPERDALYSFALPPEITSVAQVHYTRDLDLLFVATAATFPNVTADTVVGVGLKHGQPFKLVRGADFGIPPAGVTSATLSATTHQTRITLTLAQPTSGGFRASMMLEPPMVGLRGSRAER